MGTVEVYEVSEVSGLLVGAVAEEMHDCRVALYLRLSCILFPINEGEDRNAKEWCNVLLAESLYTSSPLKMVTKCFTFI